MADRPNESLSMKFMKAKDHVTNENKSVPESVEDALVNLDVLQQFILGAARKEPSAAGETLISSSKNWIKHIKMWEESYRDLYKSYEDMINQELIINRIETKAAWRNLIFRVSTTALVALTLGGAYSLAGNSDSLYLPLQQKTITYYYEGKHHPVPPVDPTKYEEPEKVVTVTGSSKGKPLAISQPKTQLATGSTP